MSKKPRMERGGKRGPGREKKEGGGGKEVAGEGGIRDTKVVARGKEVEGKG